MANAQENNMAASIAALNSIKALAQPMPPRVLFPMRRSGSERRALAIG